MRWKASSCGAGSQISTVCAPMGISFTVTAYSKLNERSRGAGRFAAKASVAASETATRMRIDLLYWFRQLTMRYDVTRRKILQAVGASALAGSPSPSAAQAGPGGEGIPK